MVPPDSDRVPPAPPYSGFGLGRDSISHTGLSPSTAGLSRPLPLSSPSPCRPPYNPARASTPAVWALPLSLAATRGVTVVFLSSAYLDVSVRRVGNLIKGWRASSAPGFPIRTSADQRPFAPPRGFSQPAASFFASGSQGIPRAPSGTCRVPAPVPPPSQASGPLMSILALASNSQSGFPDCQVNCLSCVRGAVSRTPLKIDFDCLSFHPVKEPRPGPVGRASWRTRDSNP